MTTSRKKIPVTPIIRAQQYLEAHDELSDVRLYTLLLFNAFEETMRMYLAWRLTCTEDTLPTAAKNSPHALFDLVMVGAADIRRQANLFAEARNTIAHRFHEKTYEPALSTFVSQVTGEMLPEDPTGRLVALSRAVSRLSLSVAFLMQDVPPRPETPFPELTAEISYAAEYPAARAKERQSKRT